jgi:hypothetical protein
MNGLVGEPDFLPEIIPFVNPKSEAMTKGHPRRISGMETP